MTAACRGTAARITQRLAVLAGCAAAGIALAVASDSAAHADTPLPLVDSATSLTTGTADQVLRDTAPPATDTREPEPARPKSSSERPRPVRDLVATTTSVNGVVSTVSTVVTQIADLVDDATDELPVVGRTVDTVTDLTDSVLNAPATLPPPDVDDSTQPAGSPGAVTGPIAATRSGTDTTPIPVPQPPPATGPGEPGPVAVAAWNPCTPAIPNPGYLRPHAVGPSGPTPGWPGDSKADGGGHAAGAASTLKPVDGILADRLAPPPRWRQAAVAYAQHHSGRSLPPSPPSG